jgi:hypothetical protein
MSDGVRGKGFFAGAVGGLALALLLVGVASFVPPASTAFHAASNPAQNAPQGAFSAASTTTVTSQGAHDNLADGRRQRANFERERRFGCSVAWGQDLDGHGDECGCGRCRHYHDYDGGGWRDRHYNNDDIAWRDHHDDGHCPADDHDGDRYLGPY